MSNELAEATRRTENLLARIFRDGGQRAAAFPNLDEACREADVLVAQYVADHDRLSEALASAGVLREALCGVRDYLHSKTAFVQLLSRNAVLTPIFARALSSNAGREAAGELKRLRERVAELEKAIEARDRCTAKQNADAAEKAARGEAERLNQTMAGGLATAADQYAAAESRASAAEAQVMVLRVPLERFVWWASAFRQALRIVNDDSVNALAVWDDLETAHNFGAAALSTLATWEKRKAGR